MLLFMRNPELEDGENPRQDSAIGVAHEPIQAFVDAATVVADFCRARP
jgi:hypothetical protein